MLPVAVLGCLLLACCGGDEGKDAEPTDDSGQVAVLNGFDGEVEVNVPDADKRGLTDPVLEETADSIASEEEPPDEVRVIGERVVVEAIVEEGSLPAVRERVERLGGALKGSVPPTLLQALVPAEALAELERDEDVVYVRVPLEGNIPEEMEAPQTGGGGFLGQEVAKANAAAWHAAGHTGDGVKVGIVDHFDGRLWGQAQAAGEVPAPAGDFCRNNGSACNTWGSRSNHGIAVAEVIHEMAPGAQLYLASATTTADHVAAVDYFAAQGVRIVSRSLGAEYDGPGDGTGPYADVVDYANARRMIWLNSAGNSAGRGNRGGYWRGSWRDVDDDGWLEFGHSSELLPFSCRYAQGLRWSDWGDDRTDYDLFFFNRDMTYAAEYEAGSKNQRSTATNVPPLEHIPCPGSGQYYAAVQMFHPGSGTAGDVLEFQIHGALGNDELRFHVNPGSATQPVSDSASPGMLSVGAVGDDPMGSEIAPYSSEGPTNDNRIKPDISAATCVKSLAFASTPGGCFNGTSAATPAVSGAAALVLGAGLAGSPAALKEYLLGAVVDRGVPGPDNVYGAGELLLPAPPSVGGKDR